MADIDEERRHNERAPTIEARFGQTRWHERQENDVDVIWFDYVDGPDALVFVEVELVHRAEAKQTPVLTIASSEHEEAWSNTAELLCPFIRGQERLVIVQRHPERVGGTAAFVVTCRTAAGEQWRVPVRCDLPEPPMVHVW